MTNNSQTIYCSLDIETSGFDPIKNEVLEVGFVLFTFNGDKIAVIDEYTRVFKPSLPVAPIIFGLTGISQEELDGAEQFADHRQLLQEKLQNVVIVGHNVNFDIKFLEALGIKFSGKVIDTLELVQFLLPTHHSYNLENLMHYFGVEHKNAHRALADAKATLAVLEKLIGIFGNFSPELRTKIIELGRLHNSEWVELVEDIKSISLHAQSPEKKVSTIQNSFDSGISLKLASHTIYDFPFGKDIAQELILLLQNQKKKVLLVVPRTSQVVRLWKMGLVRPVFSAELLFDDDKFTALLRKADLAAEEVKFILKILVWKAINWQTECIFDLNLSFFGGQFKRLVTGRVMPEDKATAVLCCDLQSYSQFSAQKSHTDRFVIIVGLEEFEQHISGSLSVQASWTHISYLLKNFYNPETDYGLPEYKDTVVGGLAKSDLFFGIVNALLKTDPQKFQYIVIDENFLYTEAGQKISGAAENYAAELVNISQTLHSSEIKSFAENLQNYFRIDENYVKWIEIAPNRCLLMSAPIDISAAAAQALASFSRVSFADCLGSPLVAGYFKYRLGLKDYEVQHIAFNKIQGQLFGVKNAKIQPVRCFLEGSVLPSADLFTKLMSAELPAAVLFGTVSQVKDFYDSYYQQLSQKAFLVAQNNNSGSNRMFHNFSIHKNSLLLATGKFVLKHLANSSSVEPVEQLPVKTLFICSLPFEQYTHPYQKAVSARFGNPFEQYSLPRAVYNLQVLLRFFDTTDLEKIYICDSKLSKGYGSEFKEFISLIERYSF